MANILVVDDEKTTLEILASSLKKADFGIVVSQNGREAFEFAQKEPPDLFIIDLLMPNIDGTETVKLIQQDKQLSSIPIIIISAIGEGAGKDLFTTISGKQYRLISKPFNVEKILAVVNETLKVT